MAISTIDKAILERLSNLEKQVNELNERLSRIIKQENILCVVLGAPFDKTKDIVVIDNTEYIIRFICKLPPKRKPDFVIIHVNPEKKLNYSKIIKRVDDITTERNIPLFGLINTELTEKIIENIIEEFKIKKEQRQFQIEQYIANGLKYREGSMYDAEINPQLIDKIHKKNMVEIGDIFDEHKIDYYLTSHRHLMMEIMKAYEKLD